ncbi:hypothetical protein R2R32_07835 [Clostridium perfringens]|nr:hypothetical protein [Clostridium perfringens]
MDISVPLLVVRVAFQLALSKTSFGELASTSGKSEFSCIVFIIKSSEPNCGTKVVFALLFSISLVNTFPFSIENSLEMYSFPIVILSWLLLATTSSTLAPFANTDNGACVS